MTSPWRQDITEDFPKVSVVIPAYNAESTLPACLAAVAGQSPPPMEVVLVDDGSTDSTAIIGANSGARVIACDGNSGPAVARNTGVAAARGDVILFLDSDVVIPAGLIGSISQILESQPDVAAVQTNYTAFCPARGIVSRYQNLYYHCSIAGIRDQYAATFATWCVAIRREAFLKAGGFDTNIPDPTVEDEELGYTLADRGMKIYIDRELQVTHLASYTLWQFISRRFRMSMAQAKSGWRSFRERLLKRYINIRETGTHHSRGAVLGILLTIAGLTGLATSIPISGEVQRTLILSSSALVLLAIFCHAKFLQSSVRTFGVLTLPGFVAICLLDMVVLGMGIVSGTAQYVLGRKY